MKELFEIQQKIKCPKNTDGPKGRYKYRTTEDILIALRPLLAECGCTILTSTEVVEHCGKPYVKAHATLTNEAGESVTTTYEALEENEMIRGSQGTGSASTYAQKGALNCMLMMDDAIDPDSDLRKPCKGNYEELAAWCYKNGYMAEAITDHCKASPQDVAEVARILKEKYNQ